LIRRVLYLRANGATGDTPLYAYKTPAGRWRHFVSKDITTVLRSAAAKYPELGYEDRDITARSLRTTGAMLMLLAGIDSDTRKLMGRWRSDAMFRYLHGQAQQLVAPLASKMLAAGNFRLLPSGLPKQAEDLLEAYPDTDLDDADLEYLAAASHWEPSSPDDNE
jgi:hypothetical protein